MSVRRVISVLSVLLVASATVVVAQPKKNDPKAPIAPAKDAAPTAGSGSAAGSAEGSAVEMVEDPPADMEGTSEDPDAPKTGDGSAAVVAVPEKLKTVGYPIEQVLRPITLPANMSEISLGITAPVDPFVPTAVLRARYGITRQIQLGLTYVLAGIYDDPSTLNSSKSTIHPGKAVGLDVTILLQEFVGLRIGVPVYIDPVAVGLELGAPMKFRFAEGKLALGGLDDLLTIKLYEFPPSLTSEVTNAAGAFKADNDTIQSRGSFRVSAFAEYQQSQKMALLGRVGVTLDDFSGTRSAGGGGSTTFIRAGFQYSPKKFLDVGGSLGWEDLSKLGAFAPQFYLNVRI